MLSSLVLVIASFSSSVSALSIPKLIEINPSASAVPGKYIVTLKPTVDVSVVTSHLAWVSDILSRSLHRRDEQGVDKVWNVSFKGYSGEFDTQTLKNIADNQDVVAIEPVQVFKTANIVTQNYAPWNLGSISHRTPHWSKFVYDDSSQGESVWAYVVDTGLNTDHVDFEGRGVLGYNAFPNSAFVDTQGHGTHVSGIIGGRTFGVAKKANIVAVKVFGDDASSTDIVLDGFEWAVSNITKSPGRLHRSVVSMSLGGGRSDAFNTAVENAYRLGVLTVVAAGNSYADASGYSPASAADALTVAATDYNNEKPAFSNFGPLVDVFAPGVDIESTWIGGNTVTRKLTGTSMACPHISGLALYLMSKGNLATADAVMSKIKALATKNVVTNGGAGSPNLLAYNGVV